MPDELIRFQYRRDMHLSASEYELEPINELFTNLFIMRTLQEKMRLDQKHGN